MQGNAFLGAFFAVSSLLQEFGITQEQFREVVHKQYVKKFGKLGDAVVQSNMEVMIQGFERVKEIKIGEMNAADRSTLRGVALLPILETVGAGTFSESSACTVSGCRSTPVPEGQGPRTPISTINAFDAEFRSHFGYDQPATPLSAMGEARDAALYRGELHAVHGVHLGMPGYGAAQYLAGLEHSADDGGFALCGRSVRAREDAGEAAGDREADAGTHGGGDEERHADPDDHPRSHGISGWLFCDREGRILQHY
jgi:hypothetical protein